MIPTVSTISETPLLRRIFKKTFTWPCKMVLKTDKEEAAEVGLAGKGDLTNPVEALAQANKGKPILEVCEGIRVITSST